MRRGDCSWARRQKWRYFDKTLPASVSRQVEAHLAVCIPCRADFAQAQEALDALRAGKPLTPDQQRMLKSADGAPVWRRVGALLLLLALVGVGAYLWRLPSNALFTRLNERGVEAEPIPVPPPEVLLPEPKPSGESEQPSGLMPEPLNIQEALQPSPPPTETPAPKVEVEPRPAPPAPAVEQPRKPPPPTNPPPRRRVNSQPAPKPQPKPATPAEGTVEVYDEAGNLIRREQLQEKR